MYQETFSLGNLAFVYVMAARTGSPPAFVYSDRFERKDRSVHNCVLSIKRKGIIIFSGRIQPDGRLIVARIYKHASAQTHVST